MAPEKVVRLGSWSAFWGDSVSSAAQLVELEGKNLDYLVADYLAEVTMGLLARHRSSGGKSKKESRAGPGGYVGDFITFVWKRLVEDIVANGTKVITNAGGLAPLALKEAIETIAKENGIEGLVVAAVTGDDLHERSEEMSAKGELLPFNYITGNKDEVDRYPGSDKKKLSLNAYLGAIPIAEALDAGASIVVTGRVVDSALVLGPLLHEFKWDPLKDWDQMAAASLAGHIIECGCHTTGGNFTDWELSANSPHGGWANMGFPIAECHANGDFVITKPAETGGLVTVATVAEQLVYEVLDPGSYILPDVILDLRDVKLSQVGKDRVLVTGAKGRPPTPYLKCSGVYVDGYKITADLWIGGIDARRKALAVGDAVVKRGKKNLERFGIEDFTAVRVEALGAESTYGPHSTAQDAREVCCRITAVHPEKHGLLLLAVELAPSATGNAPGITGGGAGRPHPSPNMTHYSVLAPKEAVPALLTIGSGDKQITKTVKFTAPTNAKNEYPPALPVAPLPPTNSSEETVIVPLIRIAYARSGDKGDTANIGVIARDPKFFPYINQQLTAESVKEYMAHLAQGKVARYELPGIHALNFVLTRSLGGGGLSSLNLDRQGKSYGQMLLSYKVKVPKGLLSSL
ncbi:hypothetical protein BCR41DRAFT_345116 [Lobosporangium transversale]|uniref:DUF1446-domain-containing protein n=1 Tax=Lobosporangium transversale TaxID=64571 RepID=A0A1Y2H183_9FUNG|nr:hypothetical protein BCR41DRAFT_345116 [Lobosporangium transversale]ORZ28319.1 hypothetical protein BCR41DRAFT_345116 [Lobosporangium transversale]|eukprot:XP_021886004.1 hypothetical protein BCR41DRAFT_345116 [Lobosporangium transversale]